MKKNFYIIALVLLPICMQAQQKFDVPSGTKKVNNALFHKLEKAHKNVFLMQTPVMRSSTQKGQRLDSVINRYADNKNIYKNEYQYDAKGNEIGEINYSWDGTEWDFTGIYEYQYDSNNNRTMATHYDWDNATNTWVGWYKTEYQYDANGNTTLYVYYDWDNTTNTWIGWFKYENQYDAKGNMTLSIEYDWDNATNSWIGYDKTEYPFDNNGNPAGMIDYTWDKGTNAWIGNKKMVAQYDNNDIIIIDVQIYSWNREISIWELSGKTIPKYNSENRPTEVVTYYLKGTEWVFEAKEEYMYDVNGNETMFAEYDWDSDANMWVGSSNKEEHQYDANNNEIMHISYHWDSNSNDWVESYKYEYQYNTNNNIIVDIEYEWNSDSNDWVENNKGELQYDDYGNLVYVKNYCLPYGINTLVLCKTTQYYYSPSFTGIDAINDPISIKAYPNPSTDYITVSGLQNNETIRLYNLNGQLLLTRKATGEKETIAVSHLPAGIYFAKTEMGKVLKFLKK